MIETTSDVIQLVRSAREIEGLTLSQLQGRFPSLSRSTLYKYIKDCDSSKVVRAAPTRKVVSVVLPKERPPLSKSDIGEASRQMIAGRLMLNGIHVYRPLSEDTPIDLLVLTPEGRVIKCQCKYVHPAKNGSHQFSLYSVRKNGPGSKAILHKYTEDEVDFFLGYCLDNDAVYVIPYEAAAGRGQLTIWVLREPVGTNGKSFDASLYLNSFDLLKSPHIPSVS